MSDEELLSASLANPALFEELVGRYQDAFLRKSYSILRSHDDAQECVQDTFVKIYFNAQRFTLQEGAGFKSWGYKILVNTTLTRYGKLKRVRREEVVLDDELMRVFPDKSVLGNDARSDLVAVLSRMPDHLARVLKRHFLDGWSQAEIAQEEGTSVSAVKTRVHRAKREFRKIHEQLVN